MSIRYELYRLRRDLRGTLESAPLEYHVAKTGNDSQDGKSLSAAFLTITKAITVINALAATVRGVVLYIHPGFYIEVSGITLTHNHVKIYAVDPTPESTVLFGSGTAGSVTEATDHAFKIHSGYNKLVGLTFYTHKNTKAALYLDDVLGGADYGGFNIIDGCYFSPQAQDGMAYCIEMKGANRNIIRNCRLEGAATAGIRLYSGVGNPVGNIFENNDIIGTAIGIAIQAANYNTIIRKNWFSAGVQSGEAMTNAINLTTGMTAGKVTVMENLFEQSDANDILDNKAGGTLIEMNNTNAA
ncbi:MAG: right-handed parallel beta-helix repeat-containing protein [Candidatus Omnitrophica bacterium]|nr:right-handed parallel beta-helix repeat-containing protein [Candidatus Omnitrophota bacterium]